MPHHRPNHDNRLEKVIIVTGGLHKLPPPGPPPSRPKHPNHQLTAAIRRRTEKNADALLLLRCGDANRYVLAFNAGVSLQGSRNVGGFLKFCCDGGVEGGGRSGRARIIKSSID